MKIEQFFLEGLGHQSYLITDEQSGFAVVVDPRRDIAVYLEAAQRTGAHITHVFETHLHNDYVTGACELAASTGATLVASALAELNYPHVPINNGGRLAVGTLSFGAIATPGHTTEHMSYTLYGPDSATPEALFSGGSLLVGNAGRTDLMGEAMTLTLTRQQYHSLRHLLETLPAQVRVYPTHGAGSFCMATGAASGRSTTIAQERLINPAILAKDEDDFVRQQLAGYVAYPSYYRYMRDINKNGPRILGKLPQPPALSPHSVQQRMQQGVPLIDGRQRDAFAHEHIPGSINIELGSSFGTYAGWVLPFNVPLMLLIEDEQGRREAVVQLIRIGYEQVEGYLDGGLASWKTAALPIESFPYIDAETLYQRWSHHEAMTVVDVRRADEWREGHIPDAVHLPLGDLPQHLDRLPKNRPVAVLCHSGYRAQIGASILAAHDYEVIAVRGGMSDWLERGYPFSTEQATQLAEHAHP
jgi:hydroxyacylglutathione hydrolase